MFKLLLPILIGLGIAQFNIISDTFTWDRHLIEDGQLWRLITGSFTHTNLAHLMMNGGAFAVFCWIFKELLTVKKLMCLFFTISLLTGLILLLTPMHSYVGLSGTLHGLFVWAAIEDIKDKRSIGWLLLFGVVAKISWELYFGANNATASFINAHVAINAHLCGAISGGLLQIPTLYQKIKIASGAPK